MISRYNGSCAYCKRPTKASVDHYSLEEKISFHYACRTNVEALDEATGTTDAEALAEALGFEKVDL